MVREALEDALGKHILLSAPCGSRRYGIEDKYSDYDRMVILADYNAQSFHKSIVLDGNQTDLFLYSPVYMSKPECYGNLLLLAGFPVADCGAQRLLDFMGAYLPQLLNANLPNTYQYACRQIAHDMQLRLTTPRVAATRTGYILQHCDQNGTLEGAFTLSVKEKEILRRIRWDEEAEDVSLNRLSAIHEVSIRERFLSRQVDIKLLERLSQVVIQAGKEIR